MLPARKKKDELQWGSVEMGNTENDAKIMFV